MTLATNLVRLRKAHGTRTVAVMTQGELARISGVSRATINYIERGRRETIDSTTAMRIAGALGVSVDKLLGKTK